MLEEQEVELVGYTTRGHIEQVQDAHDHGLFFRDANDVGPAAAIALYTHRPTSPWRDITTAIDGERCLLWVADGGRDGRGAAVFGTVYRYKDGELSARPEGYRGDFNVTHWMPIPEAPGTSPQEG